MTRHEILCKISHYQWLIESTNLRPAHEFYLRDQIEDLTASLAQFHQGVK